MRDVNAAAFAAALKVPRIHLHFPHTGEQCAAVMRIYRQLRAAAILVDKQHMLPGLAAVAGAKDATFALRLVCLAEGTDIYQIGICRVDYDAGDAAGLLQSHARPCRASITRFVHPIAHGNEWPNDPRLT